MRRKMMIWKAIWLLVATICLFTLMLYQNSSADTKVNGGVAGLTTAENHNNNEAFQKILNEPHKGMLKIYIPKGTYWFRGGPIKLASNTIMQFADGAAFKARDGESVTFAYPSSSAGYNGGVKNITWNNASFIGGNSNKGQSSFVQSLNHAVNINFNENYFYNCENPKGHYLDIDGSHDVHVRDSTFVGFNAAKGYEYKEAIQVDYSNRVAMSYELPGDKYDNLPTYDVSVTGSKFLPLIQQGKIKYYAPNPIGQHNTYLNGKYGVIHNVRFTDNIVTDAFQFTSDNEATINFNGVSHIRIANNRFANMLVHGGTNYIRINNPLSTYKMKDINVVDNLFYNIDVFNADILIESRDSDNNIQKVNISNNKMISGDHNGKMVIKKNVQSAYIKNNILMDTLSN